MTKVGIDLLAIFLWNIHICHGGAQKMSVFGSIYVGGLYSQFQADLSHSVIATNMCCKVHIRKAEYVCLCNVGKCP